MSVHQVHQCQPVDPSESVPQPRPHWHEAHRVAPFRRCPVGAEQVSRLLSSMLRPAGSRGVTDATETHHIADSQWPQA